MICPAGALPGVVCLTPSSVSAADTRALAARILREKQFHHSHRSIVDRFFGEIASIFDHVFAAFFGGGTLTVLGVVVGALIVLAVVLFAGRAALGVQRDPGLGFSMRGQVRRHPIEWLNEAANHEAAGRWREALRCRYRALVAELARRGFIDEVPGRTTREYLELVVDRLPNSAAPFAEASFLFEAAWYGNQPGSREESERFQALAAQVLEGCPRRSEVSV